MTCLSGLLVRVKWINVHQSNAWPTVRTPILATPAQPSRSTTYLNNWLSLDIICRGCFIPLKLLCGPFPVSADMNSSSQMYIPFSFWMYLLSSSLMESRRYLIFCSFVFLCRQCWNKRHNRHLKGSTTVSLKWAICYMKSYWVVMIPFIEKVTGSVPIGILLGLPFPDWSQGSSFSKGLLGAVCSKTSQHSSGCGGLRVW